MCTIAGSARDANCARKFHPYPPQLIRLDSALDGRNFFGRSHAISPDGAPRTCSQRWSLRLAVNYPPASLHLFLHTAGKMGVEPKACIVV
jgi:hypothetical protein